jgi:hypothetical protein
VTTRTLSGAHPFNLQHLIDAYLESEDERSERSDAADEVAELLEDVGDGSCLRCGTPFNPGEIPSGSGVTDCRCIPICSICSQAEAPNPEAIVAMIHGPEDSALGARSRQAAVRVVQIWLRRRRRP